MSNDRQESAPENAVELELDGPIAIVTLNRPTVRNSLDLATARMLSEAIERVESDGSVRVGIITGAGNVAFSAGADLRARERGEPRAVIGDHGFGGFVRRQRKKPFIAAVNGYAVGGGLEIAMACELVVAAPNATFALPEPLRGLIAANDCLPMALARLPIAMAWEIALTGRQLSAAEALACGMINRVEENALAAARKLAAEVAACAPLALEATIELMRALKPVVPEGYYALGDGLQARLMKTADAAEGSRSFLEKRAPAWSGS
ncbi:MAG: enoyl-CoA hydratase/isomerase family protein [Rhodobiaceae bacterium]|nr:enoyl-CoA hydratase/isomerase family protein [Rhodobiaceae bacterium]MCC0056262.1 enoyl-CoA hydratase/isomerase family protein [Rhodobiaceae bacterium]